MSKFTHEDTVSEIDRTIHELREEDSALSGSWHQLLTAKVARLYAERLWLTRRQCASSSTHRPRAAGTAPL